MHGTLRLQRKERWNALLTVVYDTYIFASAHFIVRVPQQEDNIAVIFKPLAHRTLDRINEADHPDHRARIDGNSIGFVVKAHISTDNRNIKGFARIRKTLNHQFELPHNLRTFGISKIQRVRQAKRLGTCADKVSSRFCYRNGSPNIGIQKAIQRISIDRDGQGLRGVFDAKDSGIRSRPDHRIGAYHKIILFKDPGLVGQIRRAQEFKKNRTVIPRERN